MIRQLASFPNQLTLLRLIFIPLIVISLLEGNYRWALALLILAGISDALDGLLARLLRQKTLLGQYLDPIADKLLLSTLFLVLAIMRKIPWKFTVMVFSRDIAIVVTCAVLFVASSFRDFRPSVFGKANTLAQIVTVFLVMLREISPWIWVTYAKNVGLWATFAFTLISGIHYVFLAGHRWGAGNTTRTDASA